MVEASRAGLSVSPLCDLEKQIAAAHLHGWPRALTWADFRVVKRVPRGLPRNALAWIGTCYRYSYATVEDELGRFVPVCLRVEVQVDPDNTGVLGRPRGRRLLKHEQGHLDLAGICGRELCLALLRLAAPDPAALHARAQELLMQTLAQLNGLNRLYDSLLRGTCAGLNPLGQWRWDRRIERAVRQWEPLPCAKPFLPSPPRPCPRWWKVLNTPLTDLLGRRRRDSR